jgi:Tfp pilus assembly PilM family ATPase
MNLNIAELKKRFQPRTSLALTLESERVAVSVLSEQESGDGVFQTFSIPVGADEISREPEKAGALLAAALNESQVRHRACVVRIPPGWAMTASIDLPDVSSEDLRSYLELCAEREFPIAVSDLRLAHSPYTMPDGRRRATLAAVPAKRIEAVAKMLAAAGCRPVSISLSLYECLSTSKPTLYFLANGTHTDVVITAGGGVVSMRSLAGLTHSDEVPFDPVSFYREIRITLGRLPEPSASSSAMPVSAAPHPPRGNFLQKPATVFASLG